MIKTSFEETETIKNLLAELKALKIVFETIPPLPNLEKNLRRESLLKSAVYSARVEGNPISLREAQNRTSVDQTKKLEINNLLSAYKNIYSQNTPEKLSEEIILSLHKGVMKNLSQQSGVYRKEPWAIFDSFGNAIYLAPSFLEVPSLIKEMLEKINNEKYEAPIKASLSQFMFEKIHPFADGNGRTGRLISAFILSRGGYGFKGMVSFEEYLEDHRKEYYYTLEPNNNATLFIEFCLESWVVQAKKILEKIRGKTEEFPEDKLLPRRKEIYYVIKDHPESSFDFIKRRFNTINPKTLHYDIKKLQDEGFIIKIGGTRGALYKEK